MAERAANAMKRIALATRAVAGSVSSRLFASVDAEALFRLLAGRAANADESERMALISPHGYVRTPDQARRVAALSPVIDPSLLFRIAYGRLPTRDESKAVAVALPQGVRSHADQRRLLGLFDAQTHPTPLSVRFLSQDLQVVHCTGFDLVIDLADTSVSSSISATGEYEPHVSAQLRRMLAPGMTMVDVGANIGYHTFLAASVVGPSGRVVAVDPNSENCRMLLLSRAVNSSSRVTILPVALAESSGHAYFCAHLGSNGGIVSEDEHALSDGAGIIVPTSRLDDIVQGPVQLIKIDVEGAEHRVLRGAERILDSHRPTIICEFSMEMTRRVSGVDPLAALHFLTDRGYSLNVLDRDTGEPVSFRSAEALLEQWPGSTHIEDLLVLP